MDNNWRSAEVPRFAFSQLWTGSTIFHLHDPIVFPPDWKAVAHYIIQAAAHPIHAYLTEETALQVAWKASFPTQKILGGGDDFGSSATSSSSAAAAGGRRARRADRALQDGDMDEEEISQDRVQQALRELHLPQPPTDNILHPELRRELFRVHRNLGYPLLQVFVRALRHAGVKKEAACGMDEASFSVRPLREETAAFSTPTWKISEGYGFQRGCRGRPDPSQRAELGRVPYAELPLLGHGPADCGAGDRQAGLNGLYDLCESLALPLWTAWTGGGRLRPRVHREGVH